MLDIRKEFSQIRAQYESDARQSSFNALISGESGTGKTRMLTTCRKPVLIDSFDPGGTKSLKDFISTGEVLADTRWENEDPLNPTVYKEWGNETNRRFREGLFEHLGTYCIDSSTTWSQAIMNQILKAAGRAGEQPLFTKDYGPLKVKLQNHIQKLLTLPCDFILTGHLEATKDEIAGRIEYRFMTTGKGTVIIPLLFDEIYVTMTKETPSGITYQLLTKPTGKYTARSRLAQDGLIEAYEEPNIKALLEKAGYPSEDKPLYKNGEEKAITSAGARQ